MKICVGARKSALSQRQVVEVLEALRSLSFEVEFKPLLVKTHGDYQLDVSLRPCDKTDFFTREIDQLLLKKKCRIAIHSAKDLPEPLPQGISCVAMTAGKTPLDALVMTAGQTFDRLPTGAWIGSSSFRRDWVVQRLRPDLRCKEVRGTIERRLDILFSGAVAGLVVAEAALVRLGLTHLNRIILPGETAPLQGKLAVLARSYDRGMKRLFAPIDSRVQRPRTIWYTGLEAPKVGPCDQLVHRPLIAIKPYKKEAFDLRTAFLDFPAYTHCILTSKVAARLFAARLADFGYTARDTQGKQIIAIGEATALALEKREIRATQIARTATQEGIIDLLRRSDLRDAYILLPRSACARHSLNRFLQLHDVRHQVCHLYNTVAVAQCLSVDWKRVDEIVFTSPSTVRAFLDLFGALPEKQQITAIGPVTAAYIRQRCLETQVV
ncbi:MAG: hydroxymethylbilane synthase [Chlamydiota bacterium]